jgi:hypothetical protein
MARVRYIYLCKELYVTRYWYVNWAIVVNINILVEVATVFKYYVLSLNSISFLDDLFWVKIYC